MSERNEARPQMARMPWFPRDHASSTRGWPLVARAIYRELLDASWDMGPLPSDPEILRGIAGAAPDEWAAGWTLVSRKWIRGDDGLLRNLRLEEHRAQALDLHARRSRGAAKTNAKRYGTASTVTPIRGEEERQ